MDAIEKRIGKLQEQKIKLDKELESLKLRRTEELLGAIKKIPSLTSIDPMTLIGGLLHVMKEAEKKPALAEEWQQAAKKFCKKYPTPKTPTPPSKAA